MSTPQKNSLFQPIDPTWLAFFRAAFGLAMLYEIFQYFQKGWIKENYIDPIFHFKFYGFEWVHQLPGPWMFVYFFALAILAAFITAGYFYRFATIAFFLSYTYMWLIDPTLFVEWNYLISLIAFLMIFVPAGKIYSLDNRLTKTKDIDTVPFWTLWILRFQFAVVYIYGGIHKLNSDWIQGDLVRGWLAAGYPIPFFGRVPVHAEWVIQLLTWMGIGIDLFIIPLLLFRKTRIVALIIAIIFHLNNAIWFTVGIFPYLMIIGTLLFIDPNWFKQMAGHEKHPPVIPLRVFHPRGSIIMALIIYSLVQIFVPLRHYLYPGDPNVTEEGVHFSWFLYSRNKVSAAQFVVIDEKDQQYLINRDKLLTVLTGRQYFYMSKEPGLILQYAHFLAAQLKKQGMEVKKIMTQTTIRVNMHEPQPLVDPNANLLDYHQSLGPQKWIYFSR